MGQRSLSDSLLEASVSCRCFCRPPCGPAVAPSDPRCCCCARCACCARSTRRPTTASVCRSYSSAWRPGPSASPAVSAVPCLAFPPAACMLARCCRLNTFSYLASTNYHLSLCLLCCAAEEGFLADARQRHAEVAADLAAVRAEQAGFLASRAALDRACHQVLTAQARGWRDGRRQAWAVCPVRGAAPGLSCRPSPCSTRPTCCPPPLARLCLRPTTCPSIGLSAHPPACLPAFPPAGA